MKTTVSHMIMLVNSAALNLLMKRAPEGTGVIAGGPARDGYRVSRYQKHPYKIYGFQTINRTLYLLQSKVLSQLKTPEEVARLRGKSVEEILGLRRI